MIELYAKFKADVLVLDAKIEASKKEIQKEIKELELWLTSK